LQSAYVRARTHAPVRAPSVLLSSGSAGRRTRLCALRLTHLCDCASPPMRLSSDRRDALTLVSLASTVLLPPALMLPATPALAEVGVSTATYNPGESADELRAANALGGLKPGTGRPLNALIKFRAETGIQRVGDASPLFKAGQILDQVRTADGGQAQVLFAFPKEWTLAGGPNLDVRDVKQSDSAFVLARQLPDKTRLEDLPDEWFVKVLLDPAGKFGQYGQCDDRRVTSSVIEPLTLPSGGKQMYRRLGLKFAPLTYNGNTVERRALLSATSVGGTVFILVAGALNTRFKKLQPELQEIQASFRAIGANKLQPS